MSIKPLPTRLRLALVVASLGSSGCWDSVSCDESELELQLVPLPDCGDANGERCRAWASQPCQEACLALYETADPSTDTTALVLCTSAIHTEDDTLAFQCVFQRQACTIDYFMMGRPERGYRRIGALSVADGIGAYFAGAAEAEESSTHAFHRLADELESDGRPRLAARCRRAARDEERHRRLMTWLARARHAEPARALPCPATVTDREQQAIDNTISGCVEELWAAALTWFAAAHASEPEWRRTFAELAHDEARHVDLSADLQRVFEHSLSHAARQRVARARRSAIAALHTRIAEATHAPELVRAGLLPTRAQCLQLHATLFDAGQEPIQCVA